MAGQGEFFERMNPNQQDDSRALTFDLKRYGYTLRLFQ
jgi:hypothetical protein